MYAWIWRKLPGHWTLKTLQSIVLVLAVGGLLVVVVFPWVEPRLPFSGNTVSGDEDPAPASTQPSTTRSPSPSKSPSTTAVPAPSGSDGDEQVIPGDG